MSAIEAGANQAPVINYREQEARADNQTVRAVERVSETYGKNGRQKWGRRLGKLAVGAALVLPPLAGAVAGAYEGTTVPSHIDLSNGVSASVSLQDEDYSTVVSGAIGAARLPEATFTIPLINHKVGGRAVLPPINVEQPVEYFSNLASLTADGGQAVKNRVKTAIVHRAVEGGGVGLATGLVLDGLIVGGVRSFTKRNDEEAAPKTKFKKTKIAGASLVALALAAGAGAKYASAEVTMQPGQQIITPLAPEITELSPMLKDAVLVGTGGKYLNQGIEAAFRYIKETDEFWQNNANQTIEQIKKLRREGKLDFMSNPDNFAAVHVSDIHANLPYIKYYLGPVLRALDARYVIFSGDLYNGSNEGTEDSATQPMEHLLEAISPDNQNGHAKYLIYAGGNHDPYSLPDYLLDTTFTTADGKKYKPIIQLNKQRGYTAEIDGATIVGSPDSNRTTIGPNPTKPAERSDQIKNDYKQGATLADVACQVTTETGKPPIVIGHEEESGFESLLRGCASIAESGHLHEMNQVKKFEASNGNIGYLDNIGSGPGDGPGNMAAVYSKATAKGGFRIIAINKATGELVNTATVGIAPHGKPTFSIKNQTKLAHTQPMLKDPSIAESVQTYAPSWYDTYVQPGMTSGYKPSQNEVHANMIASQNRNNQSIKDSQATAKPTARAQR